MRRSLLVAVALVLVALAAGCSDDGEAPELRSWGLDDPDPTFAISRDHGGQCSFDYRAQAALLDAGTGDVRWETDLPWNGMGTWVLADDTLVARVSDGGFEGLVALDATTGRPRWQRRAEGMQGVDVATVDDAAITIDGSEVVALELADGSLRWKLAAPEVDESGPFLAPSDDGVVVGHWDGSADYVDAGTGAIRWSVASAGSGGPVAPVIIGDAVVVGAQQGDLRGVDLATGEIRWSMTADRGRFWSPLDGGLGVQEGAGLAFVNDMRDHAPTNDSPARDDEVVAIDPEGGEVAWRAHLDVLGTPTTLLLDDLLVAGDGRRKVFDAVTGELRWETDQPSVPARPSAEILLTEVGDRAETRVLRSHAPASGEVRWETDIAGSMTRSGHSGLVEGQLIVGLTVGDGTSDVVDEPEAGLVLALDPETGEEMWRTVRRDAVAAPPIATDDGVAILSGDPSIFCD